MIPTIIRLTPELEIMTKRCSECGVVVSDFHQWFTEECPDREPGGHIVLDWIDLPFTADNHPKSIDNLPG